jgi:hypothetical protein
VDEGVRLNIIDGTITGNTLLCFSEQENKYKLNCISPDDALIAQNILFIVFFCEAEPSVSRYNDMRSYTPQ